MAGEGEGMALLIGTDEAGYGPNLGPLVISATFWRAEDADASRSAESDGSDCDLYQRLGDVLSREPTADGRLAVADSKQLYKPGGGLATLERGVLAMLQCCGQPAERWTDIWRCLSPSCDQHLQRLPWYREFDAALPCDGEAIEIQQLARELNKAMDRNRTRLLAIRSAVIFPEPFNGLVERFGSKGAALTDATLQLVASELPQLNDRRVFVSCDKHGGRNKYLEPLQTKFPDYLIEVRRESRAESIYRWGLDRQRIEMRFVTSGERFLPAALASMTSKYLRELAMRAFNAFWLTRVPDLRPTAGYPTDAKRFKRDIADAQTELGIDDRLLWRCR